MSPLSQLAAVPSPASRLLQTVSPTLLPTYPPTTTQQPSISTIPTAAPTISLSPTTSYMPTEECFSFTFAYLDLRPPSSLYSHWSINDADGNEVWIDVSFFWIDDDATALLDDGDATAWTEHTVCLPAGTYSFVPVESVPYIMFYEGEKIKCDFRSDENFLFTLPYESGSDENESNGCTVPGDPDREKEIVALQCYFNAIGADLQSGNYTVDIDSYFDEANCGPILQYACSGSNQPLGFNNETRSSDIEQLCDYHNCAYGKTGADLYGCQCLLPVNDYFGNNENGECCSSSLEGSEESNLSASCKCYFVPQCEAGDTEICAVTAEYCSGNDGEDTGVVTTGATEIDVAATIDDAADVASSTAATEAGAITSGAPEGDAVTATTVTETDDPTTTSATETNDITTTGAVETEVDIETTIEENDDQDVQEDEDDETSSIAPDGESCSYALAISKFAALGSFVLFLFVC